MVRAVGTLAVVGAGVLGFWVGYLLDARRNPSSEEAATRRPRTPVAA
ncbi:hypothetical protein MOQ72_07830 [Saccharopolyspora sp. K220]|nr:hypothetical protein [Saccharopolyspora soli]MCI2417330.1 hypothetical protein [Saccharopolyspora soli]